MINFSAMDYKVTLPTFEGPLDLLLHLIKDEKLDIYDIPIANISRQYLEYIELMQNLEIEIVGDFLVMAAELVRIKSKMLLPKPEIPEEEDELFKDPREELVARLLEYKKYKEASLNFREKELYQREIFSRIHEKNINDDDEEIIEDLSLFDLLSAFKKVLKEISLDKNYEVDLDNISVADKINFITEQLETVSTLTFSSLFKTVTRKVEVIAIFLALLELIKLRIVKVTQIKHFEPIYIYKA